MVKKLLRYVITLVVMTISVGVLYALYNHNIWGIQEYVADYAVILFGIFIPVSFLSILPHNPPPTPVHHRTKAPYRRNDQTIFR